MARASASPQHEVALPGQFPARPIATSNLRRQTRDPKATPPRKAQRPKTSPFPEPKNGSDLSFGGTSSTLGLHDDVFKKEVTSEDAIVAGTKNAPATPTPKPQPPARRSTPPRRYAQVEPRSGPLYRCHAHRPRGTAVPSRQQRRRKTTLPPPSLVAGHASGDSDAGKGGGLGPDTGPQGPPRVTDGDSGPNPFDFRGGQWAVFRLKPMQTVDE
ncbi:hypothetical protein BRADI_2g25834v3 [Brachypodium distachyon]|uniref:Uncharacterized protein n=1 Tax=Brachypodium distachyon TaxID=15368 RepID=A0A2K2DAI4_BRADI|nr:hypothetical protein BRADI_2g25834v3 [Brachypodium distachyon]